MASFVCCLFFINCQTWQPWLKIEDWGKIQVLSHNIIEKIEQGRKCSECQGLHANLSTKTVRPLFQGPFLQYFGHLTIIYMVYK